MDLVLSVSRLEFWCDVCRNSWGVSETYVPGGGEGGGARSEATAFGVDVVALIKNNSD